MKIWVVKYGEPVPMARADKCGHLMRAGSVAKCLAERGHDVTWWTGRFEHQTKNFIGSRENQNIIDPESGLKIDLIESTGYKSNLSFSRWRDHRIFRKNLRRKMAKAVVPDVIVVSYPIPELAFDCIQYGKQHGLPVIVDVRDQWPDVVFDFLRTKIGILPSFAKSSYERLAADTLGSADRIFSITDKYLRWAQLKGKRSDCQKRQDRIFHLATSLITYSPTDKERYDAVWAERGLDACNRMIFCWAGTLSPKKTRQNMITAFETLAPEHANKVQLVVCGRGDLEGWVNNLATKHEHIISTGFISNSEVQNLYRQAHVGLLCYDDIPNFNDNFVNKFGEYLGSGLSILTTLTGTVRETFGHRSFLISTRGCEVKDIQRSIVSILENGIDPRSKNDAIDTFSSYFDASKVIPAYCDEVETTIELSKNRN